MGVEWAGRGALGGLGNKQMQTKTREPQAWRCVKWHAIFLSIFAHFPVDVRAVRTCGAHHDLPIEPVACSLLPLAYHLRVPLVCTPSNSASNHGDPSDLTDPPQQQQTGADRH
jgi:hypothetical protein